MAITVTYEAKGATTEDMGDRFARATYRGPSEPNGYRWCIRGAHNLRYDIQQGTCDANDLPAEIREAADRMLGHAFSYVAWPR